MTTTRLDGSYDHATLRELAYQGRRAWVSAKEALGLSCRGDKSFYLERFVRLLRAGAIGEGCKVMATGKDDGAGSQAQAAMSAICFAMAHGLEYVHRPFVTIMHAETDMDAWVRAWESYFNLGHGERLAADCASPIVPVERALRDERVLCDDVIVTAQHYLHYCNQDPEAWERALPLLRAKFRSNKPREAWRPEFTVAVHVRRGDVTPEDKAVARNFTPNASFVRTLSRLKEIVRARVPGARIHLFSQGGRALFRDFERMGCELHLDTPALSTHRALVEADVLVMSKGAYSYTAGVLNEGIVLYDPQKYRALNHWLLRGPDGGFDEALFAARLDRLLAGRRAVGAALAV